MNNVKHASILSTILREAKYSEKKNTEKLYFMASLKSLRYTNNLLDIVISNCLLNTVAKIV